MLSSHPWGGSGEWEAAMAACARVLGEVEEEQTLVTETPVRIRGSRRGAGSGDVDPRSRQQPAEEERRTGEAICARIRGAAEEERQLVMREERKLRDRNPLIPLIEDERVRMAVCPGRTFNLDHSFAWLAIDVIWTVRCDLVGLIELL